MKKKLAVFALTFVLAFGVFTFAACNNKPADPDKKDGGTYDVDKLYQTSDFVILSNVKEAKDITGGIYIKTSYTIKTGTQMFLEVEFKDDKFDDVKMNIDGEDADMFNDALIAVNEEGGARRSNDPQEVKGQKIRLPRSERAENSNVFDFNTQPEQGAEATDHQLVGLAAYSCLESAVAGYRFIKAAKNVFGSYANYLEAESKAVDAQWTFDGTLTDGEGSAANPATKIEKILEFPLSYIIFTSSTSSSHDQKIITMTRIEKAGNKVLAADYAYFHISEYRNESQLAPYYETLKNVKDEIKGMEISKTLNPKDADSIFYTTSATLTNSILVNGFNTTFAYYDAKLKA